MKRWMEEESMHKKKEQFDFSGWDVLSHESCPQQHNGYDCGVRNATFSHSKVTSICGLR